MTTPADELDPLLARRVIETVGAHGTPPEWGFEAFTVGLDETLDLLEDEYLASYVADGGATFKMVVGSYGGGKTHFLYNVRARAWRHGYTVAYVTLSHDESPFHELEKVYRAVALGLMPPVTPAELLHGPRRGIEVLLERWVATVDAQLAARDVPTSARAAAFADAAIAVTTGLESTNYAHALRGAFLALASGHIEDYERFLQWLKVEGFQRGALERAGILRPIDRSTAFGALRSLVQWVRHLDYRGLVVLFDEAEQVPSLKVRQRELVLSNLREVIDECGHASFRNVMIVYAVPDEGFLEGATNVYEALRQRTASVFDVVNPSGVKIPLESRDEEPLALLVAIGERLRGVYEIAYRTPLPDEGVAAALPLLADGAWAQRFGDVGVKRLYVQAVVRAFHEIRRTPALVPDAAWATRVLEGGRA